MRQRINDSRRQLDESPNGYNCDTTIFTDADNALKIIVCCINKCETLLSPGSGEDNCDKESTNF